jgi:hypothetical protein
MNSAQNAGDIGNPFHRGDEPAAMASDGSVGEQSWPALDVARCFTEGTIEYFWCLEGHQACSLAKC